MRKYPRLLRETACDSEIPPGYSCRRAGFPAAVAPLRRAAGRCADRQPHRLHRTEAQGVAPAPGDFFNGQAGFEKPRSSLRGICAGTASRREHRVHESLVLLAIQRAIQIIVRAVQRFAVARRAKRDGLVDRLRVHDGADAVVEEQPIRARESRRYLRPARRWSAARWRQS